MKPLFNQVGSVDEIATAVEQTASAIAANSPQALAISLPLLRQPHLTREQVMQAEAEGQGRCMSSGEIREAVAAQRAGREYFFRR